MSKRLRDPEPQPIDELTRCEEEEGLAEIDDLEGKIVLGKEQLWRWNGTSEEEIARFRPAVVQLAKNVCDRLRAEHTARMNARARQS